jgi:predicted hydrocarbon binding protein
MNRLIEQRAALQQAMSLAPALSCGIEGLLGRSANSMTYVAGRKLGQQLAEGARKTEDILKALDETKRILEAKRCYWRFEPFKSSNSAEMVVKKEDGSSELMLVFRDCMIRQCLFRFGHEQKGSLCFMMYGFFSGALESIMEKRAVLDILHTGENACLKRLTVSGW